MTTLAVLLVALAAITVAGWGFGRRLRALERRYGPALSEREVAARLRPHTEPITLSPVRRPLGDEENRHA